MRKILSAIPIAILLLVFVSTTVLAINPPENITIDTVNVYGSLLEPNDQMFLLSVDTDYITFPDEPASETYLVRVFSGTGTELKAVTLYDNLYYEMGYGRAAISVYFSATEVGDLGMIWGDSSYVTLEGNPLASWNGTAPYTTANVTSWTANGASSLGARVLVMAGQFQSAWGGLYQLIEGSALTDYGEDYFTGTIPNLRRMCPTIFSSFVVDVKYHERAFNIAYALTLRNQWIGTWLDLTDVGTDWGVDAIWIYGLIWTGIVIALDCALIKITNDMKFTTPLTSIMLVIGTFIGFLSYVIGGLVALVSILITVNQLFFKGSGA